jgi:glycosyltransferase involved in cell wall biosynthesis
MYLPISAVICTHNRAEYLPKAIQSLTEQNMSKNDYEIIVVDNCSTDSTKAVVEQFSNNANLKYIYEPTVGLSYARNTGWQNASGKYVAYLDDDAIACREWLSKIVEVFETVTPQPGCVGGKVEPIWEAKRPEWLSDWLLDGLTVVDWSDTPHVIDNLAVEWLVGANIAFPKDLLSQVGGFSSDLGRIGKKLLGGEEVFLGKQIIKAGRTCFYHPEISVRHHIQSYRLEKSWFVRRYYGQGISDAVMQIIEEELSQLDRWRIACSKAAKLIMPPQDLLRLLTPTSEPDRFTQKCFGLIKVGHIFGLLTI